MQPVIDSTKFMFPIFGSHHKTGTKRAQKRREMLEIIIWVIAAYGTEGAFRERAFHQFLLAPGAFVSRPLIGP